MASTFQSFRLLIDKRKIELTVEMAKDLEVYGNTFFVLDGDVAVSLHEHKGDYVFATVGIELEASPGTFANMVHEFFGMPEDTSGTVIMEPLIE